MSSRFHSTQAEQPGPSISQAKKILVIHPVGDPQQMPTVRGICEYARQRGPWVVQMNPEIYRLRHRDLAGWSGDGVIALLRNAAEVQAARTLGRPVVNLSGAMRHAGVPRVMVDQEAIGRLAAEHLMACGLRRFAYYGERDRPCDPYAKSGRSSAICSCFLNTAKVLSVNRSRDEIGTFSGPLWPDKCACPLD